MNAWNVYADEYADKEFDTVWFDDDLDEDYVRRALIDHDGYDLNIYVEKENG